MHNCIIKMIYTVCYTMDNNKHCVYLSNLYLTFMRNWTNMNFFYRQIQRKIAKTFISI